MSLIFAHIDSCYVLNNCFSRNNHNITIQLCNTIANTFITNTVYTIHCILIKNNTQNNPVRDATGAGVWSDRVRSGGERGCVNTGVSFAGNLCRSVPITRG